MYFEFNTFDSYEPCDNKKQLITTTMQRNAPWYLETEYMYRNVKSPVFPFLEQMLCKQIFQLHVRLRLVTVDFF